MSANGASQMRAARSITASSTGCTSLGEAEITRRISPTAVCDRGRSAGERDESLERETAIGEILRVISASPSDVQPVLDAVMERAARICEAPFADIVLADGAVLHFAASTGDVGRPDASDRTVPLDRTTVAGRSIVDREPVHVADLQSASEAEFPRGAPWHSSSANAPSSRFRCCARTRRSAPSCCAGARYGRSRRSTSRCSRPSPIRPRSPSKTCACSTRRRNRSSSRPRSRRCCASSRARRATSSGARRGRDRAIRLCEAKAATIYVLEGNVLRRTAFQGPAELMPGATLAFSQESLTGRTSPKERRFTSRTSSRNSMSIPQLAVRAEARQPHDALGALMREGKPFGTMFLRRTEVRPFNDKQIALATTFADQAAIAIQNVRLFNETKEALEQQKASSEVLGAISSSIADTTPVFDKVLESCERLFNAGQLVILLLGDDAQLRVGAVRGRESEQTRKAFPVPLAGTATEIAIRERRALTSLTCWKGATCRTACGASPSASGGTMRSPSRR